MERSWKAEYHSYNPLEMKVLQANVRNLRSSLMFEVAKDLSRMQRMERLHQERLRALKGDVPEDDVKDDEFFRLEIIKNENSLNSVIPYGSRTVVLSLTKKDLCPPYEDDYDLVAKLLVAICHHQNVRDLIDMRDVATAIDLVFPEFESLLDMLSSTENCGLAELNTLHGASDIKSYFTAIVILGLIKGWGLNDPFPYKGDIEEQERLKALAQAPQNPAGRATSYDDDSDIE